MMLTLRFTSIRIGLHMKQLRLKQPLGPLSLSASKWQSRQHPRDQPVASPLQQSPEPAGVNKSSDLPLGTTWQPAPGLA